MKDDYTTNSPYLTHTFLFKGWENVLFELGRVTANAIQIAVYGENFCRSAKNAFFLLMRNIVRWDDDCEVILPSTEFQGSLRHSRN